MAEPGCGQPGGSYPTDCELTEALRERARQRNRPVVRSAACCTLFSEISSFFLKE